MDLYNNLRIKPEHKEDYEVMLSNIDGLLLEAIKKRARGKIGLLFSGGLDSVLIAYYLKRLGCDFTCYTAALKYSNEAEDLVYAKRAAKDLGLNLRYKEIELGGVPEYLRRVTSVIKDDSYVKTSIGLTLFIGFELAKEDNVGVIFSGLGAEEIFAGYQRHRTAENVNKECLKGLDSVYERDVSRDEAIGKYFGIGVAAPFLDEELVRYALRIPGKYKIKEGINKFILRELAVSRGISKEYAYRSRRAAQYGSRFDRGIEKLAKKEGLSKSEYVKSL